MTIKVKGRDTLARILAKIALSRVAKGIVLSSERSESAGDEILYKLPGIFSMSIGYRDSVVRLIKEANAFRIMERSEKSVESLSIRLTDRAALADIRFHRATWQKLYAEGRMTFAGKVKYAALVMRVLALCDRACLSEKKYRELYGE